MNDYSIFIDRRKSNRRSDPDPCEDLNLDLYHRKRRKACERRDTGKTLVDDYYAFTHDESEAGQTTSEAEQ